jgi:hypothetical protein
VPVANEAGVLADDPSQPLAVGPAQQVHLHIRSEAVTKP